MDMTRKKDSWFYEAGAQPPSTDEKKEYMPFHTGKVDLDPLTMPSARMFDKNVDKDEYKALLDNDVRVINKRMEARDVVDKMKRGERIKGK